MFTGWFNQSRTRDRRRWLGDAGDVVAAVEVAGVAVAVAVEAGHGDIRPAPPLTLRYTEPEGAWLCFAGGTFYVSLLMSSSWRWSQAVMSSASMLVRMAVARWARSVGSMVRAW